MKSTLKSNLLSLLVLSTLGYSAMAQAENVVGAGSTFAAPIYSKWAEDFYKASQNQVNYQAIGSAAGIQQIDNKTVDFGASDMPLSDEMLAKKGEVQFPTVMGGVVPVINVKGIAAGQLKLTGSVLADIYLGKIKKWNDPAIVALNPGLKLPDATIAPVRRADGSGTTFIFTNYLSKVNPTWKSSVGEGTAVNWPVGTGGKGNEGVASFVRMLPNSIGYVEYAYVKQSKMNYVQLQNAAGNFVKPELASFQAAAESADWKKSFYQILTNNPGKETWPISGATFILLHKEQDNTVKAETVLKFFNWAYANGTKTAQALDYVPMPSAVIKQIQSLWGKEIKAKGGQALAYK